MYREIDFVELSRLINLLLEVKDKDDAQSYIYIKNIIYNIDIPIPYMVYPKGEVFFRSRPHLNSESYFDEISLISYNPNYQSILNFGRANEPGQSLFYCASHEYLAFAETSEITRKKLKIDFEYMTTGAWIAQKDLKIAVLVTPRHLDGINKFQDNCTNLVSSFINQQNDDNAKIVNNLFQFLANEFSINTGDNSKHYKITAAFVNYIFDNNPDIDAIQYPSTIYRNNGLNYVFHPKSVDEKLKFCLAKRAKMQMIDEINYKQSEIIESKINNGFSSKIDWI